MPLQLGPLARDIEAALSAGELHAPKASRSTFVGGEHLIFPCRVYYRPAAMTSVMAGAEGKARLLALCLILGRYDAGSDSLVCSRSRNIYAGFQAKVAENALIYSVCQHFCEAKKRMDIALSI